MYDKNLRSEVTDINKQKFLAELGRLLTFMYEEDRQQALDMYASMFDSARDDISLMQVLVSPTRQAVVIARAYDAKERSLQVQSSSREDEGMEDDGALPDFVLAIDEVYQAAARQGIMDADEGPAGVLDDQLSLFADDEWPIELDAEPDSESAEPAAEEPVAEEAVAEESVQAEEPVETEPEDEVDAFLASFAIDESALVPAQSEESEPVQEEIEEAAEEVAEEVQSEEPEQTETAAVTEEPEKTEESQPAPAAFVKKPRIFLLILYIIAAIPMGIAGIALLLIPTVLVGALAAAVIMAGSASFVAAFSGFAVFADLLVVLGTALVVSALGLILLWLFIWFIGGAMVGLIRSIVSLGSRCCFKEVPVNG